MTDLCKVFLSSLGAALMLVTWGWISTSGVNLISVAGATLILLIYALIGLRGLPLLESFQPPLAQLVLGFGLLGGLIFAVEIALEYILLPADNSLFGLLEFGLIFFCYFLAGLLAFLRTRRWRSALTVAAATSMLASLLWVVAILLTFYLFRHTPAQEMVFRAEGNFDDFARSGMSNFDVFVMEDFFGATFFHLLLAPFAAALLGALALIPGQLWVKLRLGHNHLP
jgi:hypothetical protein